jgi:hypothetical protein
MTARFEADETEGIAMRSIKISVTLEERLTGHPRPRLCYDKFILPNGKRGEPAIERQTGVYPQKH